MSHLSPQSSPPFPASPCSHGCPLLLWGCLAMGLQLCTPTQLDTVLLVLHPFSPPVPGLEVTLQPAACRWALAGWCHTMQCKGRAVVCCAVLCKDHDVPRHAKAVRYPAWGLAGGQTGAELFAPSCSGDTLWMPPAWPGDPLPPNRASPELGLAPRRHKAATFGWVHSPPQHSHPGRHHSAPGAAGIPEAGPRRRGRSSAPNGRWVPGRREQGPARSHDKRRLVKRRRFLGAERCRGAARSCAPPARGGVRETGWLRESCI